MSDSSVVKVSRFGQIAVVTADSPPVNALSVQVRLGLVQALAEVSLGKTIKAIVIMCAGRTFFPGADIKEFGNAPLSPDLPEVLVAIEQMPYPVIAAIHGTALGGGLELALACHYRVAAASARFGLPEVKLGLLPGASGTQRLPRLVGPKAALDLMISGDQIDANEALNAGIIDAFVDEAALQASALAFAEKIVSEAPPLRRICEMEANKQGMDGLGAFFEDYRRTNARKFRGLKAPEYIIRCVEAAMALPFDDGLKIERALFDELMADPQSAAMRYAFFAEREAGKIPGLSHQERPKPIETVGVIGAGTMGTGIAMSFANAGFRVKIVEAEQAAIERGLANIRQTYERSAKKGRISPNSMKQRVDLISGHLDMSALAECDLIIEAAYEEMAVKRAIFTELDRVAKPGAILATNTSYLDVDQIAAVTGRPESVVGMHFFSPANIMRLVEIVRGDKTDAAVIAQAMALARDLGKVGVVVGVCHGFVGNRMLAQRQDEADRLILEGASPSDVDRVLVDFGLPMGPFAMADLAGLDLGWTRKTSQGATVRDRLCEIDRRGQKTGAGYYDYDGDRKAKPSALVEDLIRDVAVRDGIAQQVMSDDAILQRLLLPMINEGAEILRQGKALRASDIDVIWINGYGWPAYRGGPMYYADQTGLQVIVDRLRALEAEYGARFKPSALLEQLAAKGQKFSDYIPGAVNAD